MIYETKEIPEKEKRIFEYTMSKKWGNKIEIDIEEIPEDEKRIFEYFINKKWGNRINKEQKIIRSIMITAKTKATKILNKEIVNLENRIKELKQIKSQLQEIIPCEMIY